MMLTISSVWKRPLRSVPVTYSNPKSRVTIRSFSLTPIVTAIETGIDTFHTYSHLPWWASLGVLGITARCALLPLNFWALNKYQQDYMRWQQAAINKRMEIANSKTPLSLYRYTFYEGALLISRQLLPVVIYMPLFMGVLWGIVGLCMHQPTLQTYAFALCAHCDV